MAGLTLGYVPFLDPLPVSVPWWLVLVVLVVLMSVAYKTIKQRDLAQVARQTAIMSTQILAFMVAAALVIWLLTELM